MRASNTGTADLAVIVRPWSGFATGNLLSFFQCCAPLESRDLTGAENFAGNLAANRCAAG